MNAGMKDMLNVMSKLLALGVPLDDVVRRSTWNPAREVKQHPSAICRSGAIADIAVLRVEHGRFGFVDSYGARLAAASRLVCELTLREGNVVFDLNGLTKPEWDDAAARLRFDAQPVSSNQPRIVCILHLCIPP